MWKSIFYQSTSFDPLKISEVLQPSNLVHHTPARAHRVTSFPTQTTSETNMADSDEFSRDVDALSTEVVREILPYQFEPRVDPSQTTKELSDSESEGKCDEGYPSQPPEDGANRWVLGLL